MSYVLVVDDDADSREALAGFLRKKGHKVACASNGREAIRCLVESPVPDSVVLDARMPEMDGVSFLEVIRCYLRWQTMPVFMLTAFAEGNHIQRARELGVHKIFLKANFDLTELHDQIEEFSTRPLNMGGIDSATGVLPPGGPSAPSIMN